MKKINLSVGFIFLVLAVLFTVDIVWHFQRGDPTKLTSIVPTVFIYILSGVYLNLGFTADRRQLNRLAELTAMYNSLLDTYDDIFESSNTRDTLSKKVFLCGVHDFGEIVFNVQTSSYSQDIKDKTQDMLDDLLKKAVEVERTMDPVHLGRS